MIMTAADIQVSRDLDILCLHAVHRGNFDKEDGTA